VTSERVDARFEHFFSRKNACTEKHNFELFEVQVSLLCSVLSSATGISPFSFAEKERWKIERKVNSGICRKIKSKNIFN